MTDETGRIERLEIDGVTVYWAPQAPRSMAALQFRSGRSDEPFAQMGVSHLVEHLALYPIGRRPFHTNGFVDHVRTVFHANGRPDEVGAHLTEVAGHLAALPTDRLADESRILRTEAMQRTPTIGEHLLWFRYGATGFGSLVLPELGLGVIDGPAATAWAAGHHTRGNAAAWIAGPMPDGLRLELPAGERLPTVPRTTVDPLPLPAWTPGRLPGIALGVVIPRSSAATMAMRILTNRLEKRLRYDVGKSYEVSLAYLPLDAEVGHGSLFASALDGEIDEVRRHFLEVLDAYLESGPTDAELAEDIDGFERSADDPDAIVGELERRVFNDLLGHPQDTPAELLEEMRAVTARRCPGVGRERRRDLHPGWAGRRRTGRPLAGLPGLVTRGHRRPPPRGRVAPLPLAEAHRAADRRRRGRVVAGPGRAGPDRPLCELCRGRRRSGTRAHPVRRRRLHRPGRRRGLARWPGGRPPHRCQRAAGHRRDQPRRRLNRGGRGMRECAP